MHTVLVIGVFAAMVLAPCVVASYSNFRPVRVAPPEAEEKAEPEPMVMAPQRPKSGQEVHPGHESPLSDPTVTRTR